MTVLLDMERAGRLIGKLKLPRDSVAPLEIVKAGWTAAVTRPLAAHTRPIAVVRTRLVVEVEDFVWQKQLHTVRSQILASLCKVIGTGIVDDIEFRIGVPRRLPQREQSAPRPSEKAVADEAEGIEDPVFRLLYKTARRKASA